MLYHADNPFFHGYLGTPTEVIGDGADVGLSFADIRRRMLRTIFDRLARAAEPTDQVRNILYRAGLAGANVV
jgi:hypothetical protein